MMLHDQQSSHLETLIFLRNFQFSLFFVKKCQIQAAFCETFVITCVFLSKSKCFSVAFIGLQETVISCVNLFFLPSYQILVFSLRNSLVFKAWNHFLITWKIIELIHENTLACQVSRHCQARYWDWLAYVSILLCLLWDFDHRRAHVFKNWRIISTFWNICYLWDFFRSLPISAFLMGARGAVLTYSVL